LINQFEHRFRIKKISKTTDDDYLTALRIYNETTPYDIKTSTNEITYWIDKKADSIPFEVFTFVLYLDNKVIGLSMTTYLKKSKVVIDEYLAVETQYRINIVFLAYLSLIQNYFHDNSIEVAFFVTEISNKNNGLSIDKESQISLKVLCLEAFGKIQALYYTLPLGNEHFESNFEAFLYVKSADIMNSVSKETYLAIVKSIYYDYYYNWYLAFLSSENLADYEKKINHNFDLIKKSLLSDHTPKIEIQMTNCSILNFNGDREKTYGFLPTTKKRRWFSYPLLATVILVVPLLVIWGYMQILSMLSIEITYIGTMIGTIFSSIATAAIAIFYSRKKS